MRRPVAVLIGCAALVLCGCVVGPNYHGAPAVLGTAPTFTRATPESLSTQPAARWWTGLADPELDHLIELALAANPDKQAAEARVREARAVLRQQHANDLPTTGLSGALLHTRNFSTLVGSSGSGESGSLNLYALGFDASWEIDLFGAHARAIEGAAAALSGSQASLADLLVSLTAEVAQAYVQLRDAQQRLALTERDAAIEAQVIALMRVRRAGGTATDLDVARVENQLDTTRATLGPLRAAVIEQLDRLALLSAQAPGALDRELAPTRAVPAPPEKVAIGDPASLLRRRPDIAIAERKLAQQTAAVGENVAALFPKVTLLGDVGFAATSSQQLFNGSNFTYILAPILQWSPFDFGRTRSRIAQASAARDEAEAQYRGAVLTALEDAETALANYGQQRITVQDLARAQASAEQVYHLTEIRLRGGTADTTDVLDADTRRVHAELSYQQALAQLTEDFVALQKSLGLGWLPAQH